MNAFTQTALTIRTKCPPIHFLNALSPTLQIPGWSQKSQRPRGAMNHPDSIHHSYLFLLTIELHRFRFENLCDTLEKFQILQEV